jgi:acyl-[acyl carrier protein]--UDP-N-acetylglucosamine O-acyltransferase
VAIHQQDAALQPFTCQKEEEERSKVNTGDEAAIREQCITSASAFEHQQMSEDGKMLPRLPLVSALPTKRHINR